jgi:hypothetical protein
MKSQRKNLDKKYDSYVEHPRYGRYPRHTALNPNPYDPDVHLHSNATNIHEIQERAKRTLGKRLGFLAELEAITPKELRRIAGTAIHANPSMQNASTVAVTHYYDVERVCRNCKQPFIFFAEEQMYWFEELQFPLDADCIRCPVCRKAEQFLARNRSAYEKLAVATTRDSKDNLKMAGCALTLVEHGVFHNRVLERVAALLKTIPEKERQQDDYRNMLDRLKFLRVKKTQS